MNSLQVLQSTNFEWTTMLQSIWGRPTADVPELSQSLRNEFKIKLQSLGTSAGKASPAGWVICGTAGSGKTHLLGHFRTVASQLNSLFVLVDMTDVRDFWETVLLGYFASLQQTISNDEPQYERVLQGLFDQYLHGEDNRETVKKFKSLPVDELRVASQNALKTLSRQYSIEVNQYGDVFRALVALNSDDFTVSNIGATWLQGETLEPDMKNSVGLMRERMDTRRIVEGLAWLMSFTGPTVVAFDQLDPIVTQFQIATELEGRGDDISLSIMNNLCAGFSALRDATSNFRTLLVVTCIEMTWNTLQKNTPASYIDRFEPPRFLRRPDIQERVAKLIQSRLMPAFDKHSFEPPYPTWPFPPEALQKLLHMNPREILKRCHAHISECIQNGRVIEYEISDSPSSDRTPQSATPTIDATKIAEKEITETAGEAASGTPIRSTVVSARCEKDIERDEAFQRLDETLKERIRNAQIDELLLEENEDSAFAELLVSGLRMALKEVAWPMHVDATVDTTFSGGDRIKPLHARVRLVFTEERGREEHYCYRAIQRTNASAFQSRLKSAITQAGIDTRISFRQLFVVRSSPFPRGPRSVALLEKFLSLGGIHLEPELHGLQTLCALAEMERLNDRYWDAWLLSRRPATSTSLLQSAAPYLQKYLIETSAATPADTINSSAVEVVDATAVPSSWTAEYSGELPVEQTVELTGEPMSQACESIVMQERRKEPAVALEPSVERRRFPFQRSISRDEMKNVFARKSGQSTSSASRVASVLGTMSGQSRNSARENSNAAACVTDTTLPSSAQPINADKMFDQVESQLATLASESESAPPPRSGQEVRRNGSGSTARSAGERTQSSSPRSDSPEPPSLLLGRRDSRFGGDEQVRLPLSVLDKHAAVFAGAGSGKTVLLKRLIEEAALSRVPAIVIDCANDLVSIGSVPDHPHIAWSEEDRLLANRFKDEVETVVWTPGRIAGNPLGLPPLPDLPSLVDSPDELNEAIEMVIDSLGESVIKGTATGKEKKCAILRSALDYMAKHCGNGLDLLAEILAEFPEEMSVHISDEKKIGIELSNLIRASVRNNAILNTGSAELDPAMLLGDDTARVKTRVSVISLVGLKTVELQRHFINQLAMTLFTWIKKNPTPPDRPLRGLLVIDEARDFIPSGAASSCLGSLRRLAAQARKYKLGVVFATQNPKDIDTKIVGQCSTQWHGKMNAPAAIAVADRMLADRQLSDPDTASLSTGLFYVSNTDVFKTPIKTKTAMCLSEHVGPWEEGRILEKAVRSRSV